MCGSKIYHITNGTDAVTYNYDGKLVTSASFSGTLNKTLSYSYNNDFNVTGFTYGGFSESYAYDNDGLLTEAGNYTISRNAQNGLPESVFSNKMSLCRTFNGCAEIDAADTVVNGSDVYSWDVSRDDNGRITSRTETLSGTSTQFGYAYDEMGRLLQVSKNGITVEEYTYNDTLPYGIRTTEINALKGISGRTLAYDDDDGLLYAGDTTYMYNVDGFLTTKNTGTGETV